MRRSEKACDDKILLSNFLSAAQILHLAMPVMDVHPYIVPLNYVYDGNFYVHSATEGRKISLLRTNPLAGFAVCEQLHIRVSKDNPCATGTSYKSVVGKVEASFIENNENKTEILNMLMAKYVNSPPLFYKDKALNKLLIIKLKVLEMTFKIDLR